ncbi:hypothetical protein GWO43_06660 [candidate division KSB1 bacterium]|nr:hypothetical protein [candidate division KSB1 bacterium]NIR72549.1 hypothetical protein [candidate division KSB1 bacterium]NIS23644.1 hypothetical protein [candidate division KSB1 bacterium]NIT70568.1 hypothetical protein [candidate division KSB1 bacterium]NIU24286.1 hypothetical protein [candidate division KSB1 bacterium]
MKVVKRTDLKQMIAQIQAHFRKGISKQEAIGMSIVLHLVLGLMFGAPYMNDASVMQTAEEDKLVLDLVRGEVIAVRRPAERQKDMKAPRKLGKKMGSSERDSKMFIAEEAKVDKRAVMMASLSSLVELRESFNFVIQQVSADSIGAFTPIQGSAPDTKFISDGSENGNGFGSRSGIISITGGGRGSCPPGGGDILE